MKIPPIKAIVQEITPVITKTSSEGKSNRYQSLIVTVPGYVDGFGEKKGRDEDWEFQLMNDDIDKHSLRPDLIGKKVTVASYLNSRKYQHQGENKYPLTLRLASVEVHSS